eukprot:TRINITY_DN11025_c0_g1_i1.p1 TRINITY_DN11025_c0_g1~~TRINITY_DN11025_c0_g1_i1.p1  ORF type:complete len:299 (+),score=132.12 TRINITY_DN11025_c0_g1_i1:134-1030(+)
MGKGRRKGEVWMSMRKLERLQLEVGLPEGQEGSPTSPAVDTSKMTRYEKGRYEAAQQMSRIRNDIQSLDDLQQSGKMTAQKKAELSNRVRKGLGSLKTQVKELAKDADKEGKLRPGPDGSPSDYDELSKHMTRTQQLWRRRNAQRETAADDEEEDDGSGSGARPMKTIDDLREQTPMGEGLIDPRQDEEFQVFFEQTKQRDQEIDEALDRVHAGITRLHQNALSIKDELACQNKLLEGMNEKAAQRTEELRHLNTKLKDTLKEVEKDKFCCYLICLLMVLCILGVLASQMGLVGGGDD